jgi:hypothetical protein
VPASSVETFFACSLMVILVVSGMAATAKVVQPYLNDLSALNTFEPCKELSEYLLLSAGEPPHWGNIPDSSITIFGLASGTGVPYDLDIDKITRLNKNNVHSISYNDILAALDIPSLALKIRIEYLFDIFINLTSILSEENATTYTFRVSTHDAGSPISVWLQCYTVIEHHVENCSSSTSPDGVNFVAVSLPNSLEGKAMFLVFAKAKADPQIVAFSSYSFVHNSETLEDDTTFLNLNPFNHILNVSFQYPSVEVANAYVFTYNYNFNLTGLAADDQTQSFRVPNLLDPSPMILLLNGKNASTPYAEWVSYPQLPLEIGVDSHSTSHSRVVALTYTISVISAFYKLTILYQNVEDYNVQ